VSNDTETPNGSKIIFVAHLGLLLATIVLSLTPRLSHTW